MPLIALFIKAEMEGVEKIVFPEDDVWKLDVCQSGGTETREGITIDPSNEEEIPNSKGTANFLIKWEGAKAPSTISVITPTRATPLKDKEVKDKKLGEYSEVGTSQPVAIFDCRGAEPVKWYPAGLTIETAFGKFESVDLSDCLGDNADGWMECSENGDTASIEKVSFEFKVVK
eukprot:TRINITY_DN68675_c0_g1_i1.p1 TRINITY_DN68675_c0_g1~~TRINITY_DN68675_c0_g1_i1.p1  ORF type:complete len:174 (+),score=43.97 TRINITY_DN68675_c0_g1_i1:92-613(+)